MNKPYLSVVIPVYNEEASLEALYQRLIPVLDGLEKTYEVILVNDGSHDQSSKVLEELYQRRPENLRIVEFNRNYGQHMAIMAGFERVRGEVVVTMDADLQNPPEDIPKLLALIDQGHDVVGGIRANRQDPAWRIWISKLHKVVRKRMTDIEMDDSGCMLRAYRREIVDLMVSSGETSTFINALAASYAANPIDVPVGHDERQAGESNYNLYKLIRYNFDLLTNFSVVPLQIFTFVGIFVALGSLALFVYLMVERCLYGPDVSGVFTLFAIVFFLMGVMLTGLGIVGEYIGRIYYEVRRRPRFVVKRTLEKNKD